MTEVCYQQLSNGDDPFQSKPHASPGEIVALIVGIVTLSAIRIATARNPRETFVMACGMVPLGIIAVIIAGMRIL